MRMGMSLIRESSSITDEIKLHFCIPFCVLFF
ncbi:hypothetical protein HNQ38_001944 [Desulfovibrio intestinalis]|uniref:Uncharacterized protein n=1 Tax=Desulfovibrio intestinalis TaxID=58621 RepID=A0A7W8C3S5_9BACT|nr:hypothetical protein [Desulfovibrio intestinalis]